MTNNPYTGSSFDDFLQEEGLYTECSAISLKARHSVVCVHEVRRRLAGAARSPLNEYLLVNLPRK